MTDDYQAAIRAIVDAAPPLTQAQRDKLAVLLDDDTADRGARGVSAQPCPCGTELESAAALALGVCDYCRGDAKKPVRRRRKPGFVDVPIPGLEDWGKA
jgi:hypothetical protein